MHSTRGDARKLTRTDPLLRNGIEWERYAGEGDPQQRYRLYRLCECDACDGTGKTPDKIALKIGRKTQVNFSRCLDCRGEGRTLELVATAGSPEAVGLALVTLGREGEWSECPVGILDTAGAKGEKWIVTPWLPSARNVSDAGRLLRSRR